MKISELALRLLRFDGMSRHSSRSWSQEGEDLILKRYFSGKARGFYVDVGAHHPTRFSNTNLFHQQGWSGVNIDAMPGSMKEFRRLRPNDVNLELGVAEHADVLTYYIFNEPALNGFSKEESIQRDLAPTKYKILDTVTVRVRPLAEILSEAIPPSTKIDFLTVDVEGLDLAVLKSNDWDRFRPTCIVAESLSAQLLNISGDAVCDFLLQKKYEPYAKTGKSVIYIDRENS